MFILGGFMSITDIAYIPSTRSEIDVDCFSRLPRGGMVNLNKSWRIFLALSTRPDQDERLPNSRTEMRPPPRTPDPVVGTLIAKIASFGVGMNFTGIVNNVRLGTIYSNVDAIGMIVFRESRMGRYTAVPTVKTSWCPICEVYIM